MIAFLSRLFRRPRAGEPAWIDAADLQRRIASGDAVVLVDVRQPEEFASPPGHLPDAINVPLGDLPGWTADLAACWWARRTGVRRVRHPRCLTPGCAMSPCCVAAPTAGISGDWHWNNADWAN